MDTTGEKIVDAQGRVLYENGKWTPAAENTDAMRIGNAMMITPTGTKVWNDMAESATVISMEISYQTINTSGSVRLGRLDTHIRNGEKSTKMTIYEKSINEYINPTKLFSDFEKRELMKRASTDERIGAVAVHEGTHALDDKMDKLRENRAVKNEKKYLQEVLEQKPIGDEKTRNYIFNL